MTFAESDCASQEQQCGDITVTNFTVFIMFTTCDKNEMKAKGADANRLRLGAWWLVWFRKLFQYMPVPLGRNPLP
jgi:hypothetical protein